MPANENIPDRLSTQRGAPYYKGEKIAVGLRISVDGVEQLNAVIEYSISAGWVRTLVMDPATGQAKLNMLKTALATKLVRGKVEVWRGEKE